MCACTCACACVCVCVCVCVHEMNATIWRGSNYCMAHKWCTKGANDTSLHMCAHVFSKVQDAVACIHSGFIWRPWGCNLQCNCAVDKTCKYARCTRGGLGGWSSLLKPKTASVRSSSMTEGSPFTEAILINPTIHLSVCPSVSPPPTHPPTH